MWVSGLSKYGGLAVSGSEGIVHKCVVTVLFGGIRVNRIH